MRASEQYSRKAFLHEAAKIEGIYVPSLYEVRYKEDGTIAAFTPVYDDIPATIKKQVDMDLTGSVYPENRWFHLSKQHRIAWCLKYRGAVSADAVLSGRHDLPAKPGKGRKTTERTCTNHACIDRL